MREFTQAGVELVGAPAPEGTAEVVEVLAAALDAAGLNRAVIGLGDADLYRQLLDRAGRRRRRAGAVLEKLATHDLVGLEAERRAVDGISDEQCETLVRLTQLRGGHEVLDEARGLGGERRRAGHGPHPGTFDALGAAAPASGSRSTSGCCATSATTRRDPRGL